MRYRPLGRTGQFVSEICLGAMTFSGGSGFSRAVETVDQQGATALVERAPQQRNHRPPTRLARLPRPRRGRGGTRSATRQARPEAKRIVGG
ncbi:MAG: hypothetical protein ABR878_02665 [Roseiarcus sp.]